LQPPLHRPFVQSLDVAQDVLELVFRLNLAGREAPEHERVVRVGRMAEANLERGLGLHSPLWQSFLGAPIARSANPPCNYSGAFARQVSKDGNERRVEAWADRSLKASTSVSEERTS